MLVEADHAFCRTTDDVTGEYSNRTADNEGVYNDDYYDGTVLFPLYQPTPPSNQ
jgi:hypothetical protein